MAIKDEQLVGLACLSLSRVIKHLFKLGKAYIVVCPS